MTPLVPVMLFGWVPLTILLFFNLKPHRAVLVSVIGGWLFLPHIGFNIPGLPEFTKETAIAIGLILGGRLSGHRQAVAVKWTMYDLPIFVWCIFSPISTSLANELGIYDGLSGSFQHIINWGVPYIAGRIYFDAPDKFKDLFIAIIIGGLLYMPLCLFEMRMSPKLSKIFYGFFPASFAQHIRYGGYRPIVFMQHGLMVALWMAISSIASFWYWRTNENKFWNGIPLFMVVFSLACTTVLCKSVGAMAILAVGCACYVLFRLIRTHRVFVIFVLVIPCYIIARSKGFISSDEIISFFSLIFDEDRIKSVSARLLQEDLISEETFKRAWFGWGGWGRGMPVDADTGKWLIGIRDALWLIKFNTYGMVGICSLYLSLLIGPFMVLGSKKVSFVDKLFQSQVIVLCLTVVFFCVDSLANGMTSPLYIAISGSLVSLYILLKQEHLGIAKTETIVSHS